MEAKATRAQASKDKAATMAKKAQKRLNGMKLKLGSVRRKAEEAESIYKRALKTYEEAKKRCNQFKAQGENVPAEGEKDLSAAGAWKSPAQRAARERDVAKAQLGKLKAVWE